jgi:hypothetical protein
MRLTKKPRDDFCEDGTMSDDHGELQGCEIIQFGPRPIPPRTCVIENRTHVRMFLADMLDELGFIVREADPTDARTVLREFRPDLLVLGPLGAGLEVQALLRTLHAQAYAGAVMLFGGRSSDVLINGHELGERAGLMMLPPLGTPFRARDLHANLERFLPIQPPPPLPVDVNEALCNNWLELWYQSKIDSQSLVARRRSARSRSPPHMGCCCTRLFHSGSQRSLPSRAIAFCDCARTGGFRSICRRQESGPDLNPPATACAGGYAIY